MEGVEVVDCIPYINDLLIEIDTLSELKEKYENTDEINKIITEKKELLERCKYNLNRISDNKIEYRLYLKIINGLNPSKAVEEIADENYKNDICPSSVASIWRIYKNMKKNINL